MYFNDKTIDRLKDFVLPKACIGNFIIFILVQPVIEEIQKLRLKKSDFEIKKTIGRGHFGEV